MGLEDESRCCGGFWEGAWKRVEYPNPSCQLPVLVLTLLLALVRVGAATSSASPAVSHLVVDFGSDSVLQLQDILKGHAGEF